LFYLLKFLLDRCHLLAHHLKLGCICDCLVDVALIRYIIQHQRVLSFVRCVHELIKHLNFILHKLQILDWLLPLTRDFFLIKFKSGCLILLTYFQAALNFYLRQTQKVVDSRLGLTNLVFKAYFFLLIYIFKICRHWSWSHKPEDILQLSNKSIFLWILIPHFFYLLAEFYKFLLAALVEFKLKKLMRCHLVDVANLKLAYLRSYFHITFRLKAFEWKLLLI